MSNLNWIVIAVSLVMTGCGGGLSKHDLQSAQSAADKAIEMEKNGNYAEAFPLIDQAITKGGLNPDQL